MCLNIGLPEWQLIATILLGLLTIAGYFILNHLSLRRISFLRLDEEIDNLVNTWIKYPLLEDDDYIKDYHEKQLTPELRSRFDAYCTLSFNVVDSLYNFYSGNRSKMKAYCEYEEMIITHKEWWKKNQQNPRTSYKGKFVSLVEEVIAQYESENPVVK